VARYVSAVPTAADVLDDQAYVQEEMHRLAGLGFQITVLPLAGASRRWCDPGPWSTSA